MPQAVDKIREQAPEGAPIISRAQMQEIEEDPSKIETVARLMGVVNLDNLFRFMQRPDINPQARIEFQKLLNKMGKLESVDSSDGAGGPQVVINITRAKDHDDAITIEGKPARALD